MSRLLGRGRLAQKKGRGATARKKLPCLLERVCVPLISDRPGRGKIAREKKGGGKPARERVVLPFFKGGFQQHRAARRGGTPRGRGENEDRLNGKKGILFLTAG